MRRNSFLLCALALSLIAFPGCKKKQKAEDSPVDYNAKLEPDRPEPNHFLSKTFAVKRTVEFSFVVPPHSATPHLQGTFTAFVPRPGDEPLSDDTTNVEFLLLDPDQYTEFSHGNVNGTALYSAGPTHSTEVDYSLSPTNDHPATYYVIFRSSAGGAPVKSVKADFTVSYGF
jgi:hypothetical protein